MRVPHDQVAEAEVVACALAEAGRAAAVLAVVCPEDCYAPHNRALLAAAAMLHDIAPKPCDWRSVDWAGLWPWRYPWFEHLRAAAAATIADLDLDVVREAVDERGGNATMRHAEAVGKAARARRAMAALADAYNALGEGAYVEDVAELVASAVA